MSKMDAVRAMREARYAEAQARAGGAMPRKRAARPAAAPAQDETDAGLCGHRNMSGRTCTRERGHAAKTHRYS
ncbi:hypothetical protein ACJ5H2_11120 [Nocardioides sp. R1-1]|uniref:hypothetical protein n=1 Tax=Nocardioides sp. R1-1 TaxID=3383502 RepID=UPI0038CFA1BA